LIPKALLVLFLVMAVLFAWRAWRPMPGLALIAAAIAAAFGVLLLKSPVLAAAGLVVAGVAIAFLSRPRR